MSHWFKWNVSNIVKNWVGNTSDIEKGIEFYALPMLEGSSVYASYMKTFGSVQADSKYRPYFYIEYNQLNDFSVAIKSSDGSSPNKIKVDTAKDLDVSISNVRFHILSRGAVAIHRLQLLHGAELLQEKVTEVR